MPKGVILHGPPGTGKTLFAKAIAGETDSAFISVSGSDFVEMYVGVGAARIRELFKKAGKHEKCVIFIDEIDAIGKRRSGGASNGGSDEKDQTLNALLTEMCGFKERKGILVIAATNRLDVLDEALLRPGRFDRQEELQLPDLNARKRIIDLYIKNKPVSEEVSSLKIAKDTVFFSGAMLENMINEAAINAAKSGCPQINANHIDKAYFTIIAGSEKKDRSLIRREDAEITAYHEAGHALATKILAPENRVSRVTIIPSSKGIGGFSVNVPPESSFMSKAAISRQIMICLSGRAAEELKFGADNITTGASNDIERATRLLKDYVCKYGMSEEYGLLNLAEINDKPPAETMKRMMNELYAEAKNTLLRHISSLNAIAELLLAKETIDEDDLNCIKM